MTVSLQSLFGDKQYEKKDDFSSFNSFERFLLCHQRTASHHRGIRNVSVLDIRWRSKRVVYAIIALASASAFMTPVCATNGQTETPEITTVRLFLAGIENHDLESQLSYLTPDAQAYRLRNGKWIVSQIRDVLISGAKGGGCPLGCGRF